MKAASPPVHSQIVEVHSGRARSADSVHLKVCQKSRPPSERECGWNRRVDLLLCSIKPDRAVGNVALVVSGKLNLNVVPGVGSPRARVAAGSGVKPQILRIPRSAGISRVIPG